jgi:hypothetical protein
MREGGGPGLEKDKIPGGRHTADAVDVTGRYLAKDVGSGLGIYGDDPSRIQDPSAGSLVFSSGVESLNFDGPEEAEPLSSWIQSIYLMHRQWTLWRLVERCVLRDAVDPDRPGHAIATELLELHRAGKCELRGQDPCRKLRSISIPLAARCWR